MNMEQFKDGNLELSGEDQIKLRNTKAVMGLVKSAIACGVIIFVMSRTMLIDKMLESGDEVLTLFGNGFRILLILMLIICIALTVRDLLVVIFCFNGMADQGFGLKYIAVVEKISANAGHMIQIVMGGLFVFFSIFAIKDGPSMLAEGNSVEGLYVVSGIFIAAGAGLAIAGVVSIIKSFRAGL